MRIGLIQCNPTLGDFTQNAEVLLEEVRGLTAKGAEICVAPAFSLCGAGGGLRYTQRDFLRKSKEGAVFLARRLAEEKLPALLLGSVEEEGGSGSIHCEARGGWRIAKSVVLALANGKSTPVHSRDLHAIWDITERKSVSTRYSLNPSTQVAVAFLEDIVTLDENGFRVFKDPAQLKEELHGVYKLFVFGALFYDHKKKVTLERAFETLACETGCFVLFVNLVGGADGVVCYGGSLLLSQKGTQLAALPMFSCTSVVLDTEQKKATEEKELCWEAEMWQALVLGIRDHVKKCGFMKVTLGLSGGVDSALVAALAVEAVGAQNVTCLLMPSLYSSHGSIADSLLLARNLAIETHTISISPMFAAYKTSFEDVFPGAFAGLTEENIQSRIRGALIMAYANQFGAMVLTTGNKSELAVGYCTLYGDMSGGLAVLGDVYKTQVYGLCYWRNQNDPDYIPEAIIKKAPSAELRPDQKDVDSLPDYPILDAMLRSFIEKGKSVDDVVALGFAAEDATRVNTLLKRAEFKRQQAPPVIQVSSWTFGKSWKMPIAGM